MKKGSITISVPAHITNEDIKRIRKEFKKNEETKDYRLNIIISGESDFKENLVDFIKTMV